MKLYYYGLSDPGMVRPNNEDYLFAGKVEENQYLFIVADGMGGHQAGEVASRKAVTLFVQYLEKYNGFVDNQSTSHILESLKQMVHEINENLIQEGSRSAKKNGMGTTLSVLYIKDDQGYIVHVGDSRIYRYENDPVPDEQSSETANVPRLKQLTEDHSFVGKLVKDGFISEEEARNHPKRNVLYQSIGLKKDINIQTLGAIPIRKGQKYLLCSDGLYGVVPDTELHEFLEGFSTKQIAMNMVKKANFNGGPDNVSLIVVSTEKDDTTELEDTVRIVDTPLKRQKKKTLWFFILLGLLVLLLALIIYFLIQNTESLSPLQSSQVGTQIVNIPDFLEALIEGW